MQAKLLVPNKSTQILPSQTISYTYQLYSGMFCWHNELIRRNFTRSNAHLFGQTLPHRQQLVCSIDSCRVQIVRILTKSGVNDFTFCAHEDEDELLSLRVVGVEMLAKDLLVAKNGKLRERERFNGPKSHQRQSTPWTRLNFELGRERAKPKWFSFWRWRAVALFDDFWQTRSDIYVYSCMRMGENEELWGFRCRRRCA